MDFLKLAGRLAYFLLCLRIRLQQTFPRLIVRIGELLCSLLPRIFQNLLRLSGSFGDCLIRLFFRIRPGFCSVKTCCIPLCCSSSLCACDSCKNVLPCGIVEFVLELILVRHTGTSEISPVSPAGLAFPCSALLKRRSLRLLFFRKRISRLSRRNTFAAVLILLRAVCRALFRVLSPDIEAA